MYTRKWLSTSSQFYLIPKTKHKSAAKTVNKKETKLLSKQKIQKIRTTTNLPENNDPKVGFFVKLKKAVASRHCYHEMRNE